MDLVAFAKCEIIDDVYVKTPIHKLWAEKTAILIFLRHFACIECRAVAQQIWSQREKYEEAGGVLHFIGNGRPQFIEAFKEDLGILDAPTYTDPTLEVFRAAGFKRGFKAAIGFQSLSSGMAMYRKGHRQAKYEKGMGDLWQMGGVVVVKPGGHLAYHFISEVLGDFPPADDLKHD